MLLSSTIKKRTIKCAGRVTSISLEDDFWTSLRNIARERHQRISHLITELNGARQDGNLSSAIRMFVLSYYRDKLVRPTRPRSRPKRKRARRSSSRSAPIISRGWGLKEC
jgi:predicted DNA-binding ribbon-helix-helix protein